MKLAPHGTDFIPDPPATAVREPLDVVSPFRNHHVCPPPRRFDRRGGFGIWSVRWSADGREILAGTDDSSLYVYDVAESKVQHAVQSFLLF